MCHCTEDLHSLTAAGFEQHQDSQQEETLPSCVLRTQLLQHAEGSAYSVSKTFINSCSQSLQDFTDLQPFQSSLSSPQTLPPEHSSTVRQGEPARQSSSHSSEEDSIADSEEESGAAAMLDHGISPLNVSLENWNISALRSERSSSSSQHLQVIFFLQHPGLQLTYRLARCQGRSKDMLTFVRSSCLTDHLMCCGAPVYFHNCSLDLPMLSNLKIGELDEA